MERLFDVPYYYKQIKLYEKERYKKDVNVKNKK